MGKQVIHRYLAYSALWASKWYSVPLVHSQFTYSALWAIRCTPVHYGQAGDTQLLHIQCKMGKQVNGDSR